MMWNGITFVQSSWKSGHLWHNCEQVDLSWWRHFIWQDLWVGTVCRCGEVKTHMSILNMTGTVPTFVSAVVWEGKVLCAILLSGVNSDKNYLPWHAIELVSATAARHSLIHLPTRWGPTTLHNKGRWDKFPTQWNGSQYHQIPHS